MDCNGGVSLLFSFVWQKFEEAIKTEQAEKHALEKQLMSLQQKLQRESQGQRELATMKKQYASLLCSVLALVNACQEPTWMLDDVYYIVYLFEYL